MRSITTALSLLAAATTAIARERPELRQPEIIPGAYIIEFDEGVSASQFRTQTEENFETRVRFDHELFKGVSIQLSDTDTAEERAAQLSSLPAVKNIWPVTIYPRPEPEGILRSTNGSDISQHLLKKRQHSNQTAVANAPHVMTQVDRLHAKGITGKGVTIAVIDTGIDYDHPALGGCFGKGCLVSYGHDLVGDDYTGGNDPVPDDDPDDTCAGHGTHVAGIIAASGENPYGFLGAAPGVNLAAYRVFGCFGGTSNEVLLDAFHRAYEEGADVISVSIGGQGGWPQSLISASVSRIVEKGVPCIVSAGNSGPTLFSIENPADGKSVTGVASFASTIMPMYLWVATYTVDDGPATKFPWDWCSPEDFDGVERELWVTSYDVENARDACDPLPDDTPDLSEYIVLIRRSSECDLFEQVVNVAAKGTRYLVVYNNVPGTANFGVVGLPGAENIQGAAVVLEEVGQSWVKELAAGKKVKATFKHYEESETEIVIRNNPKGGAVNHFSSRGPTKEIDLKPQFGAPGGNIISTYPLELGGYYVLSGTSMAAPFVSAAYALIAEARKAKPEPAFFEQLLSSTAKPVRAASPAGEWKDWLDPPAMQGGGLIQVYDAAYATSYLEPSSLSFNDTRNFAEALNFTIINTNEDEVTYDISHISTRTLYTLDEDELYPSWPEQDTTTEHAELDFSSSKVTVAPGQSSSITVVATPPRNVKEARIPYWSGFIAVNGSDGSSFTLPYQGLAASLYDVTMTDRAGDILVVDLNVGQDEPLPPNTVFTFPAPGTSPDVGDGPFFLAITSLLWGSAYCSMEVVPVVSNSTEDVQAIGQIPNYPVINVGPLYFISTWDGSLADGDYAPAGRYKFVQKALRIGGDRSKEEDYDIKVSREFSIKYQEETA